MKSFTSITLLTSLICSTFAQYQIDPNSVSNSTKQGWCQQQTYQCPLICSQTSNGNSATDSNSCDADSLTYSCVCSNGQSPNVSEYSQTLPYYICQQWGIQCQSNCNGDNQCQAACTQNHPCGAQNPRRVNLTSTSSTMAATGSPTGSSTFQTGFASATGGSGSSSTSTSKSGAAALAFQWGNSFGHTLGGAMVFSGMLAGFAVML